MPAESRLAVPMGATSDCAPSRAAPSALGPPAAHTVLAALGVTSCGIAGGLQAVREGVLARECCQHAGRMLKRHRLLHITGTVGTGTAYGTAEGPEQRRHACAGTWSPSALTWHVSYQGAFISGATAFESMPRSAKDSNQHQLMQACDHLLLSHEYISVYDPTP